MLKDYRGFSFCHIGGVTEQVAAEWWEDCGWKASVISMHLRFTCYATNLTLALMKLWFTHSHSGKCWETKIKPENGNEISKSKETLVEELFYVCSYGAQNVDFFKYFLQMNFLIFLADWLQMISRWKKEEKKICCHRPFK